MTEQYKQQPVTHEKRRHHYAPGRGGECKWCKREFDSSWHYQLPPNYRYALSLLVLDHKEKKPIIGAKLRPRFVEIATKFWDHPIHGANFTRTLVQAGILEPLPAEYVPPRDRGRSQGARPSWYRPTVWGWAWVQGLHEAGSSTASEATGEAQGEGSLRG